MIRLLILLFISIILIIIFCKSNDNYQKYVHKLTNIIYISKNRDILKNAYVNTLKDDTVSEQRFGIFQKSHKKYKLPISKINYALHYTDDAKYIKTKYPMINKKSQHFKSRPGAYGLCASFFKFLETNKDSEYAIWYEDDAIPTGNINEFWRHIDKSLAKVPVLGNDIYSYAHTNYCRNDCKLTEEWKLRNKEYYGGHALILSKSAINTILKYISNGNIIYLPIDKLFYKLMKSKKYKIHVWDWDGNIVDSGMFCGLFDQYGTSCEKRYLNTMEWNSTI